MLVSIQFPIADSRPFVDLDTGKLGRPNWPYPFVDQDFIRAFGIVRTRWCGGLSGWIGEYLICNAIRALRFDPIPRLNLPNMPYPIVTRLAFRRFYADGIAVAKFEVGLLITPDPSEQSPDQPLTRQFFEHFLRLPVSVPALQGNPVHCEVWQAGKHLAALYLASSSTTEVGKSGALPSWLALPGNPIVLVEYSGLKRSRVSFPSRSVTLAQYPDAFVSHFTLPMKGLNLRLWMLNNTTIPRQDARRLRIALLRLHAERECLQRILTNLACGHIQAEPRGAASNRMQDYFNFATRHVLSIRRRSPAALQPEALEGEEEEAVVEQARQAEDSIMPGERDSILRALQQMQVRKNILHKVGEFVAPTVTLSAEVANMARVGMDDATKEKVVMILATQAANGAVEPELYFLNLVRAMALPQQRKNEIIGGWKGNTEYDARRLVDWALGIPLAADKEPTIINLVTSARTSLGAEGRAFFDGIIVAYQQAAAPQRPGAKQL